MSTNKDLANQLAAMRTKAKQAAAEPATKPEPIQTPPEPNEPAEQPATPKLKVLANRRAPSVKQGRGTGKTKGFAVSGPLERTTITLKAGDNEALSDLQSFLMKRVRKASSTSTLIRLALFYTKQALPSNAEALAEAYYRILKEDGRKKAITV